MSESQNGAVVVAHDVTRRYGEGDTAVDALRGVTVEIAPAKATAVMGPSGSGKSTLMHILAGLDKPTSGSVGIAGTEITTLGDNDLTKLRREHIGFVFQFFNLLPMLDAKENILLPLTIAGEKPDSAWFDQLVSDVGLGDRLSHRPAELSGGQQQRVAIARALVSRPTVLFADEPTGNLDSATSAEILELLRRSVDEYGQTIVMVTHDARAAAIAHRVLFLADGVIVRELGECDCARRSSASWKRSRRERDEVRHHGAPEPQAAYRAHRDRDRPRRRDDQRHVRPDGLDRPGVRQDLHRHPAGLGRGHQRQVGVRHVRSRTHRSRRRSTRRSSRRCGRSPEVAQAEGSVSSETTHLIDQDGKVIQFGLGGAPNLGFSIANPTVALQPADARLRALAGTGRGRDRQGDGLEEGPRGRARTSASRCEGPVETFRIAGIVQFSSGLTIGGATLAGFDLPTAQSLFRKRGQLDEIAVAAKPNVTPAAARRRRFDRSCRRTREVRTASQQVESDAADTNSFISFLRGFLLAFGGIALFVGSFVIANSLSITIAQRTRELATLRTLGASRRQVLRSIIIEALVVGVARVGRRPLLRAAPREGAVLGLRPRRLHPSEHGARVPHAHVRDRRARGRNPRDADREPAPCDPRDSRSSDRGRARGRRSSRLPSTGGSAARAPCSWPSPGSPRSPTASSLTASGRSRC